MGTIKAYQMPRAAVWNGRRFHAHRTADIVLALVISMLCATIVTRADESVDFQREIRPIFADHCFPCHGPDEGARQADFRLDVREVAVSLRISGKAAIVPGNPANSQLLRRISSDDPETVMPPPDQGVPLTSEQRSLLRRWIGQGAPYSDHWAFSAPRRSAVPDPGAAGDNYRNPIDAFVADRLGRAGLTMSPSASSEVLCRRIYLDVIGLPPSPNEMDEFREAARRHLSTAATALVDRLLDSDHFGEKWARHWLDVARYADSNGYEKDLRRDQWAWRDWVIRAINADMSYDQFIVEQIAGDLLPNRTQGQLVATGFLRNGMVNEEGGIVPEQFRMEGLFDRMDCIGKAVLGLSLQCAQCHSHKFDPISQEEYYGMFAFLNDTCEAQSQVYSPAQQERMLEINAAIYETEDCWKTQQPDWKQQLAAWEEMQQVAAPNWKILDVIEHVWIGGLNHPEELRDHSVMVLGHPTTGGEMYLVSEPVMDGVTGLRMEALTHGDLPFGGPGRNSFRGTFAISELGVEVMQPGKNSWSKLPLQNATADFSEREHPLEGDESKKEEKQRRVGPVAFLIDGEEKTAWRPDRGPGRRNTDSVAVVQFADPVSLPAGTQVKIKLVFKHSAGGDGRQSTILGRMRLALTKSPDPRAAPYDHAATIAMQKPAKNRGAAERAALFAAWRKTVPELKEIHEEVSQLQRQYPEASTSVLSLSARELQDRRGTFLLDRGEWDRPQHQVAPQVPAILHPLSVENPDRLAFARWLVVRRSPLAARVQVNRVWQAIFGTGLVKKPEDFGTRTLPPVHVELLDWLAMEFMDHGWSTKHLIRTILSSATYQQTARATEDLLEIDPINRLLGRGPRFRAEAEVVRDIALCVSGLLNPKIGGPSIFPPMPKSVLDDNFTRPSYWKPPNGPERYRRAIYLFRKRSMPDPVLTSFDAPNADFACAGRVRSNMPLAALVSLNEPVFSEAARALGLRILCEGGATDQQRADYAFRICTGRSAKPAEQAEVLALLNNRRARLGDGSTLINEIATGDTGTTPSVPSDATPQDAAAWTIVARVLLNLDETLSKN